MSVGLFQLAIIAMVVLVLFGRNRISDTMGDFGKGIKNFRQSLDARDEPVLPAHADTEVASEPQAAENAN